MVYKKILFFMLTGFLCSNSDAYEAIQETQKAIKSGVEISAESLYLSAKSAYMIEEYAIAISFLRHINDELYVDEYEEERNKWVRMVKEVELLTDRYKNDPSELNSVLLDLEQLRSNAEYYENCSLVQGNFEKILEGEDSNEYKNCAYIEYNIGKIYFKEEDYSKALKYYKLSNSLSPDNKGYQNSLNSVLSYYIKEAGDYVDFKDYGTAVENYLKALEYMSQDNANYNALLYKIAQAYYYDKENEEALIYLKMLIDIEDEDVEFGQKDYNALYLMGECYRKIEAYDQAIKSYELALEVDDESAKAYYKLGRVYASKYEYEEAIENYEYAIYYNEKYHQAYESLGIVYQTLENPRKAIENYKLSVANDPRNFQCLARLARMHNDMGKYEEARAYAEECLLIKRNYAGAYFEIGRAEKALGNPFDAITYFEKAQKNSKYRRSSQAEIKEIKEELSK